MSTYKDKIQKHTVHTNLTNVQNELKIITELSNKPPADVDAIARITQVISNFALALKTCDKNLIATSWLDEVARSLSNIKSYLSSYKSNRDPSYLTNHSFGQLDSILQCTVKLNCVKSRSSYQSLTQSIDEYTNVIFSNTEQSHLKVQELSNEIDVLKKQIDELKKTSEKSTLDFQSAIETERKRLDGFSTSYQQQMNADQNKFTDMLSELKDSFKLSQEERKKDFSEALDNIEFQQQVFNTNAEDNINEIVSEGKQLILDYDEKFQNYEKEVANMIGVMDSNIFSHKYKEVANNAHNSAVNWHKLAIVLMIAVGIFAIITLVINVNSITTWTSLIAKIFTTTTLVTSAAYAARQASKQEKVERIARKIEMELVSIDAFIASLDEERQATIKEEVAKKLFGNPTALEMSSKEESYVPLDNLTAANELIKSISDIAAKMNK